MSVSAPNLGMEVEYAKSNLKTALSQICQLLLKVATVHTNIGTKETRHNGLPQNTIWKVCPDTILRLSVAKIQRNLKITVFQEVGIHVDSKLPNQI